MTLPAQSISELALSVLTTEDAVEKANASRRAANLWFTGEVTDIGSAALPARPARPAKPVLTRPGDVKKRKITSGVEGRLALLHALAHIELNAIDLAWDIVGRFTSQSSRLPIEFYQDWVTVADDEARHFLMLNDRLVELDGSYGDLPAHDGLWQASVDTAHDLLARLAVVPLVLEARGLDVTPAMIKKLRAVGDDRSADALQIIHDDEITHVAAGKRWFDWLCEDRGLELATTWKDLVGKHFKGAVKPPFNEESRSLAGMEPDFYQGLAASFR